MAPQAAEVMTQFAAVQAKPAAEAAKACADAAAKVDGAALASAGFFEALETAANAGKKKEAQREAAAMVFGALAEAEHFLDAYMLKLAPTMIELVGDKTRSVSRPALEACNAYVKRVAKDKAAANGFMQKALGCLESTKFPVKVFGLDAIAMFATLCPDAVCTSMPELVPATCGELHDTKKEVVAAAEKALRGIAGVIENKDINELINVMIDALMNPTKVPDCVFSLSCTKFVATVQRPELALVTPLLVRGFQTRETKIVRQCAKITENMSKLVEVASEAEPLLPTLRPEIGGAAEHTSDPECREVCGKVGVYFDKLSAIIDKEKLTRLDAAKFLKMLADDKSVKCSDSVVLGYVSEQLEALFMMKELDMDSWVLTMKAVAGAAAKDAAKKIFDVCEPIMRGDEEEEEENADELCNCNFTLAYGTKILLKNTTLRLLKGIKYGLLGPNECGKTSLLKAIAADQVEGFPPSTEVRTVSVEADILGELSHLTCLEYIFQDERIQAAGISRDAVQQAMSAVGFAGADEIAGGKAARIMDAVSTLSGGWRMKLALARAMLQKADILLMDDPTNHLDVMNVAWVENYIMNLKDVTCLIVSSNPGLLNKCVTRIVHFDGLKLKNFKGSLDAFVAEYPECKSYFELKSTKGLEFAFPDPSFIEGVNSRGKVLMKMDNVDFGYPGNPNLTVTNMTVRVSMASRVACLGPNGAGKSTMIKLLTGELEPKTGTVWKHPNCKIAYVAQHAFHHIEQHLRQTPCEYILWRYEFGTDKEALNKVTMVLSEKEEAKLLEERMWEYTNDDGLQRMKAVIDKLTGIRKSGKRGGYQYEVRFKSKSGGEGVKGFIPEDDLNKHGWEKHVKLTAEKIAAEEGRYKRPLTQSNVEKLYADVGLEREYASHYQMNALSSGQKVKVVLAAAMWDQPHVVILDEPTNYLDRESLAALAVAITNFKGGVVIITHNDQFSKHLCPETWIVEKGDDGIGRLELKGDADWMEAALKEKTAGVQMDEMVDALGNVTKVQKKKKSKKEMSRKERKARDLAKKKAEENGEPWSSSEDEA